MLDLLQATRSLLSVREGESRSRRPALERGGARPFGGAYEERRSVDSTGSLPLGQDDARGRASNEPTGFCWHRG